MRFLVLLGLLLTTIIAEPIPIESLEILYNQQQYLERELINLTSALEKKEASLIEIDRILLSALANTQMQSEKSEELLKLALIHVTSDKNSLYTDIFDKNKRAKKYFAKRILANKSVDLHEGRKKIEGYARQMQTLEAERELLTQKIIEGNDHLVQVHADQSNIYEKMALQKSEQQKSTSIHTPIKEWDINNISPPLDNICHRARKKFFGALFIDGDEEEPVKVISGGEVIFSDTLKGLGHVIMVQHSNQYMSIYGNCKRLLKNVGDQVSAQEIIALVGHSGHLGENALYFEVRKNDRSIDLDQLFPVTS